MIDDVIHNSIVVDFVADKMVTGIVVNYKELIADDVVLNRMI